MNAKVSVIIPAYNEEKNIKNILDSVCSQTFKNIEVLCVDDKSTDNTFTIIKEYAMKDGRIIPLVNPEKGVASARNFGIQNAIGEYLCFFDADDSIHPQMIELLYKAVKEKDSNFALCDYSREEIAKNDLDFNYEMIDIESIKEKSEMLFAGVWNKIVKKSFIIKNGIRFEKYKIGEDTVFSSMLFKCNLFKEVPFVNYALYLYNYNSDSTLSNMNNQRRVDMVKSRVMTYEILKQQELDMSIFYLEQALIYIVKYKKKKYFSKSSDERKQINGIYLKHIFKYIKYRNVSIANKVYVLCSFFFGRLANRIYADTR